MKNIRRKPDLGAYVDAFDAGTRALPDGENAWLARQRVKAIQSFETTGFPTRRTEEWRYTSLKGLTSALFAPADKQAPGSMPSDLLADLPVADLGGARLVFVNGHYTPSLSRLDGLADGISVETLDDATAKGDLDTIFQAETTSVGALKTLNTAYLMDGAIIRIAAGVKAQDPIELVHVSAPPEQNEAQPATHLHHIIMAGAGANATFVETYVGETARPYWTNVVLDVSLAADARVDVYKVEDEGKAGIHTASVRAHLDDRTGFNHFSLLIGGQTARQEIDVIYKGHNAESYMSGAYLAGPGQSLEIATFVDHATPDNISHQAYRGVLDQGAKTAFQGKVMVRPDAQHTNADQSNHNLMLHRSAEANTKPELEIYADDVKCNHGATVGELDQEALFYLKARGIDEATARSILVEAFVGGLIDEVELEPVQTAVRRLANRWLARRQKMYNGSNAND